MNRPQDDSADGTDTEAGEAVARAWVDSLDRSEGVGARHHIVPRFYLQRFADEHEQVAVVTREQDAPRFETINNIAVRDFYTFVNDQRELDGRLEQVLQQVEGDAARVIRRLTSPLMTPTFGPGDRVTLATFVGFQLSRGQRKRREIEMMADLAVKVQAVGSRKGASGRWTEQDLETLIAVPHPNEHLRMLGGLAEQLALRLLRRPIVLWEIDYPGFITCDEPVLLDAADRPEGHLPTCHPAADGTRAERRRQTRAQRKQRPQILHVQQTHTPGIDNADEIWLPLDPRRLLVFGPVGSAAPGRVRVVGDEARDVAAEVREHVVRNAYLQVFAHPSYAQLSELRLPPAQGLLNVCGVHPALSSVSTSPPWRARPALLRDRRDLS